MKDFPQAIHLGRILMKHRHQRGITQEELAAYIGVSKATVSKWETSTTYPDITMLPQLAAFFDISIDTLMGYEPQLTKEGIRRLYRTLSREFSEKPFDEVTGYCQELTKKYFSCAPLLFQIGALYLNHCSLAGTAEKTASILEEAMHLFARVREKSDDMELQSQAVNMEAFCLLQLGRPQDVPDLLGTCDMLRLSPEPLLARAWQMLGNPKEAKSILQASIYHTMLELLQMMLSYQELCMDQKTVFEETYRRIDTICSTFQLDSLHPAIRINICLSFAHGFLLLGDQKTALDLLEQYTDLACRDFDLFRLHGDTFFDLLDDWLEENLMLGSDLPREETLIRNSMLEAVAGNPDFAKLSGNPRFQMILRRLQAAAVPKKREL